MLQVWGRCEALTAGLSSDLAEQLRLVLEPQLASRMAGEYRTGKRISMKRVIAYIASHFRKDKIWLRRTQPDKRKYQASPAPSTSIMPLVATVASIDLIGLLRQIAVERQELPCTNPAHHEPESAQTSVTITIALALEDCVEHRLLIIPRSQAHIT